MVDDNDKSSDAEIIRRVLQGETDAFGVLLVRYQEPVFRIIRKHVPRDEVEEIAQEVFVRAFKGLGTVDRADRFKQWITTVAVRTCYDFWRRRYRSREIPVSHLTEQHRKWLQEVCSDPSNETRLFQREAREVLQWALDRLSAEDRTVFEMVYLQEQPVKEAAQLLGWSVVNVKVRAHRCRKKLKKLLESVFQGEIDETRQ